jgi:hypothetical protein
MGKAGYCWLFTDTVGGVLAGLSVAIQTDTVSPSLGAFGLSIACKASARDTVKIIEAIADSKLRPISKRTLRENLKGRTTITAKGV